MKKYIPYAIMVIMSIAVFNSMQRCTYSQKALQANTAAMADTVTYFTNKIGMQTASIQALVLEKEQMQQIMTRKDSQLAGMSAEFVKVHTVVKFKTIAKVDTVFVAFQDKADTLPAFKQQGAVFDKWYSFDYKVDANGLSLANLSMQSETAVVTGIKRKWFLGRETLITDVSETNPYINISQLKAAEVSLPAPWYKKWYVWLAAGAVGGVLIAR